jgi:hypothetical protein
MPARRGVAGFIGDLGKLALAFPLAAWSCSRRYYCISMSAFLVGRLVGSLKNRTIYL